MAYLLLFDLLNRKIQVSILENMVNPLDITLEALQNVQDAVNEIKVRKNITTEKEKLQDYDKIIKHLEGSISDMLNAVVIFQKYEKAL
jgi:hypothetical protein